MGIGYFLSSEEHSGPELVEGAALAEQAGFASAWISDHFHPWLDEQGQSPFVWSVLGAIAARTKSLRVYTAVTCPTVRLHPVVVAQATATTAQLFDGRFGLGVGTGEALNEHVVGAGWPPPAVRLEMLEEAIDVLRRLWTGKLVSHRGLHYTVENARIYTLPAEPPAVLVSAFGKKSLDLAARVADGLITTMPNAEMVRGYRDKGGRGVTQAGMKVCWHPDRGEAVQLAHRLWRLEAAGGQMVQDLPTPKHFAEATQFVTPEMVAEQIPCGPDPDEHLKGIRRYLDAGFDEVYVAQIGPDQAGMIDFYAREILPALS